MAPSPSALVLAKVDDTPTCTVGGPDTPAHDQYDELPEETFDRLTRTVTSALRVPSAILTLLVDGQHVVKSSSGSCCRSRVWRQIPAARDFCARAAVTGEPIMYTPFRLEESGSPSTTGERRRPSAASLVSYAVIPMKTSAGVVVGTLAAIDPSPRVWTKADLALLCDLAAPLVSEIELRLEMAKRRESQEQLLHTTLHDALTGLPNRTLFVERMRHAVLRAKRHPEFLFAVLFLDLDRFKVINDSLGHIAGDDLLIAVAARLKAAVRPEDTVARLGGDEFAVLLEGIVSPSDAGRVAKRIQNGLSTAIDVGGYEVFTSVSIGIVLSTSSDAMPEVLVRNADMAMYRAKARGGACYQMFDHAMHASALARLQLETDLRHAVERGEFRLDYQPIVSLATGRVAGLEALVRWNHPVRGLVQPGEFISVAEEMGLIVRLGRWVLGEACRHVKEWREACGSHADDAEPLWVSVNLSARQFAETDLALQVAAVLRETGLEPSSLCLEITESVVVENTELATTLLTQLKALGVRVYMDDFGTGYSSLSYLHQLPIDAIKIDRAFVSQMDTANKDYQFVRTMLTLARSVGVRAVAEGVVRVEQLAALRMLGCEYAQGFLFSMPLAHDDVKGMLKDAPVW